MTLYRTSYIHTNIGTVAISDRGNWCEVTIKRAKCIQPNDADYTLSVTYRVQIYTNYGASEKMFNAKHLSIVKELWGHDMPTDFATILTDALLTWEVNK